MSKIKIHVFTIADYEEEEIWLRRQHQQGLRFVKTIAPCFYVFEECTPEDVVYRLDFQNCRAGSDYKQMFADYGWEYSRQLHRMAVFPQACIPDPAGK